MFNYKRVDILWALIGQPCQNFMATWICLGFPCRISSVLIYYGPHLEIWVKRYNRFEFAIDFPVQLWVSLYIMGLKRTSVCKVIVVWICPRLPSSILSVSIYYVPQLKVRLKSYGRLNFLGASSFNDERIDILWTYIKQPCQKFIVFWICIRLHCRIWSVLIRYGREQDIRVKSYDRLNLPGASLINYECLDI